MTLTECLPPGLPRALLHTGLLAVATLAISILAGYETCRAASAELPASLDSDVLTADREFAAQAQESGIRAAYNRYLAENAVLFRPLPVPAREWLGSHEPASGGLEWSPAVAETACDASLAVTLGTWWYRARDSKSPESGQYLTVWRRSESGDWRIVLDQSISLATMPPGKSVSANGVGCSERPDSEKKLLKAERKQNSGLRSLRAGDTASVAISAMTGGALLGSSQADLAVTHGALADAGGARGSEPQVRAVYVRIWEREGAAWRVLHEFITPVTP
jgi:ketosteroid isomerase-like protein